MHVHESRILDIVALVGGWLAQIPQRTIIALLPALSLVTLFFLPPPASAGPPFITDDPAPPGNHHWEINFGWIAGYNPGKPDEHMPGHAIFTR